MKNASEHYKKAAEAIREVYRKGDSEELLALRYIAGSLAEDKTIQEREAASQQSNAADANQPCEICGEMPEKITVCRNCGLTKRR